MTSQPSQKLRIKTEEARRIPTSSYFNSCPLSKDTDRQKSSGPAATSIQHMNEEALIYTPGGDGHWGGEMVATRDGMWVAS